VERAVSIFRVTKFGPAGCLKLSGAESMSIMQEYWAQSASLKA